MIKQQHKEEIEQQLEAMRNVCTELEKVATTYNSGSEPPPVIKSGAAFFLAQLYSGIENILKLICKYKGEVLPSGDDWHVRLLGLFRKDASSACPAIIDDELYALLSQYRRIRHVVRNAYSFELEWKLLVPGIENAPILYKRFETALQGYVGALK